MADAQSNTPTPARQTTAWTPTPPGPRRIVQPDPRDLSQLGPEARRVVEGAPWRRWGPYLSERQWGTVREDYSADGQAWSFFPHDHSRSRAYRWGEDGIAGFSDEQQLVCLSLALWNGKDPILKERLFGLTGPQGNHGEDVKELYYYLDASPSHSYLKYLYKYPQAAYPYQWLIDENARRTRQDPEFELLDTGIFQDDRYFDVFVEYAKAGPNDLLMQITAHNRGPDPAPLHVLPQCCFRNTWSWSAGALKPTLSRGPGGVIEVRHQTVGTSYLYFEHAGGRADEGAPELLFCENETNNHAIFNTAAAAGYFKDAFHYYIVGQKSGAVNPGQVGTKCAGHHFAQVAPGGTFIVRVRFSDAIQASPFADFEQVFAQRRAEADGFYADLQKSLPSEDARNVQRQAWAGMIWGKQSYHYDVRDWLNGDPAFPPPPPQRRNGRNSDWQHLNNGDVMSMPDKWEYPWYAAWDLAFHCIPFAQLDPSFAKHQLLLLTREWFMHPNGELPAYEWSFGDVNPPVHAWATWRVYQIDRDQHRHGQGDLEFLARVFHKLLLNFTWWVNRKDLNGRNIFEGGFLGLDNIGVFDRSAALPTGGYISQSDGTSWMAMYCLNLMRIALELAMFHRSYEDLATKFFEHFLYIAAATTNLAGAGIDLWDAGDEFFYDVLCLPNGQNVPLKVRSMVGLIPLFAVEVLDPELLANVPQFRKDLEWFFEYRPDLAALVSRWFDPGRGESRLLSLLRGHRMKRLLLRMLDETEFLSDYGVRALSRVYKDHPYVFNYDGQSFTVSYQSAESNSDLFGGNSNWRGPIWMPVNFLIIESLRKFHTYYGEEFKIECPTGSGTMLTLQQIADELSKRLTRLFLRDAKGARPIYCNVPALRDNPHFRDHLLFFEYFDGDNGRGVGANHQTGWTGLVAALLTPPTSPSVEAVQSEAARVADASAATQTEKASMGPHDAPDLAQAPRPTDTAHESHD